HRDEPPPDVFAIRRNLDRMSRLIPPPPRGIEVRTVDVAGMRSLQVTTPRTRPGRHLLYLHGGAYSYGSPAVYRDLLWRLADATQSSVLGLRYRLAPEHPFPAAVDDAVAGYRWLLAAGAAPDRIAIAGDSAGGGLAFATLLRLRDQRVPLPAAAAGLSPWTDLTFSGPSFRANAKADPMLNATHARFLAKLYLGGSDPSHPHASPLLADHAGLPP